MIPVVLHNYIPFALIQLKQGDRCCRELIASNNPVSLASSTQQGGISVIIMIYLPRIK
jgi:hypothetical protein